MNIFEPEKVPVYARNMKFEAWAKTDTGLKRETNQDCFLIDYDLGLFVVADGMGGHKGGEVAAAMAVEILKSVISENPNMDPRELLTKAYRMATYGIYQRGQREIHLRGMATTMVAMLVRGETFYIANVGDSRAYLLMPPGFWLMTEDHSLFNEQLKAGLVKEADREHFEGRNIITRSVGFEPDVKCDVIEHKAVPGEVVLLCSDGLYGLVSDQSLASLSLSQSPEMAVDSLVDEAKKRGGDDNITLILVRAT
jgi:PPM family protein phosphatase